MKGSVPPAAKRKVERYDEEKIRDFMHYRAHVVPQREMEVYVAYWVEGRSATQTAKHLGLAVNTVNDLIKKLRTRIARKTRGGSNAGTQAVRTRQK